MAFELLRNACITKKYTSFTKLPLGNHLVEEFSFVQTQYGDRIRADLGDKYVYLPERFSARIKPEHIPELNENQRVMVYNGRSQDMRNQVLLEFKCVDELDLPEYLRLTEKSFSKA